jgi:hypothetical protein
MANQLSVYPDHAELTMINPLVTIMVRDVKRIPTVTAKGSTIRLIRKRDRNEFQ